MIPLMKAGANLEAAAARGMTPVHLAAETGQCEVLTVLLEGGADINQTTHRGLTPLHVAAVHGHCEVVSLLINAGADLQANTSGGFAPLHLAADREQVEVMAVLMEAGADLEAKESLGFTALHMVAHRGHLAGLKALVKAGADLEATGCKGLTPLHEAVDCGQLAVIAALVNAGANINSRLPDGDTPLYLAAWTGQVDAARLLLRMKANPLLARTDQRSGLVILPLDAAAGRGHLAVVQELLQEVGIEGCGNATDGVRALVWATEEKHLDIIAVLVDAGVVDTGEALCEAARSGAEPIVKFLLQQHEEDHAGRDTCTYVNAVDDTGATPLLCAVGFGSGRYSPRVARLLIDAGADTTLAVRVDSVELTPLVVTVAVKKDGGQDATEEQVNAIKRIRRLLLQVEAVHAMSWLWRSDVRPVSNAAHGARTASTSATSLQMTLPTLRWRARRRGVVLAPLFRFCARSAVGASSLSEGDNTAAASAAAAAAAEEGGGGGGGGGGEEESVAP